MQYFKRAMHEGYQESSADKAQRLGCAESNPVIFRYDDSTDHHNVVVFRHDDSVGHHINISARSFRHDGSAGRSQRTKEISSQEDQAQYCSNTEITLRSLNTSTQVSKLTSIERYLRDELSATNLAPNGAVNRWKSKEKGFERTVLDETRAADAPADIDQPAVTEEKNWFDLPYDDLLKQWEAERPVVTGSDTEDEDIATVDVAPADEVQQVQDFEAPISAEDVLSADEKMSLDDILLSIPVDIPLPSTCMEVTKITMGQIIKILGVTEKTWFLNSLPRIPADDKGKEILVDKDPVKGNPAEEHYSLICADIDLLVDLRAKVIDEVATFFNSFSLKNLASINIEEMYRKEEQNNFGVEIFGGMEGQLRSWPRIFSCGYSSHRAALRPLSLFLRGVGKGGTQSWSYMDEPSCSKIFEGCPRDRGAVIARSNSNTLSLCWIRRMLLIDGLWAVEFCADRWVKIPKRKVISTEVPRQRQFDDTLPTMSVFFKLLRKRWADVCVEVVEFGASPRLLPIGSTRFCISLQLVEPVSSFAPSRPTVFALRFSQFCSVFIDLSLFSWLPSTDISEFLSSIALDRTILRSVQRSQDSFAVAPSVQLSLEQHQSSSSSDSSSSLHFDQTYINATVSSRWLFLSGCKSELVGTLVVVTVAQKLREHCDVLSMQMDSDLVIYRTTLVRTFQVVTICRVDKSEVLVVQISPHYSKRH
ncbi:hypothetical protein F511_22559 [Dorcoceras hygrometricum]|uniref:Uncharacterized protein n=1 Tax=Dorcoceras hygrometricum TaxID=472368 RepID=A0A2Z7D5F8_9LAMI|nr:hypothetical protein F511_22559 [Dorcoceras hygrometricum]